MGQRNTNLQQKNLRHLRNLRAFYPKTEQVQNLCKSAKSVGQRNTNLQQKKSASSAKSACFLSKDRTSPKSVQICEICGTKKILQLYHFQIIRNEDSTLEVLGSFTGIIFFTISERFLLRMIQDKILHAQFLRQFSGIKRRTVAFLIRLALPPDSEHDFQRHRLPRGSRKDDFYGQNRHGGRGNPLHLCYGVKTFQQRRHFSSRSSD